MKTKYITPEQQEKLDRFLEKNEEFFSQKQKKTVEQTRIEELEAKVSYLLQQLREKNNG